MRQPIKTRCANDNAPLRHKRTTFGQRSRLSEETQTSSKLISDYRKKIGYLSIIPVLAITMVGYAIWQNAPIVSLIWPSILIAALLIFAAKKAEPLSRLRNVSSLLLVGAVTAALVGLFFHNGFQLMAVEIALMVSAISLCVGWAMKSRPTAMLSAFAGLGYLASLFPQLGLLSGIADGFSQIGVGLIPLLLLGQAALAKRLKSFSVTTAVILGGYIWLFTLAKDMPLNAIAAIGFALAAAHYCLGKAWESQDVFGARLHIILAGVLAMATALYLQSIWISTDAVKAVPFWPPSTLWWSVLTLAMLTLFVSTLMRYKESQISLIGIFIISLAAIVLPLTTAKPDLVFMVFDHIPGLNPHPGMGLIIGAAIIACGLIWIVQGLKHNQLLELAIGAAVVGVEIMMLYQPDRFNMDFGVIFIVSLICALCVGGLIAGSTKAPTGRRYQHA